MVLIPLAHPPFPVAVSQRRGTQSDNPTLPSGFDTEYTSLRRSTNPEQQTMIYAHIYKARGGGYELSLSLTCELRDAYSRQRFPGLREAKAAAKAAGAKPWNY